MWNQLKRQIWEWRGVWIAAPSVTVAVILLRFMGVLQPWEWAVYDLYMRARPSEPPDNRIAIVGINEADVRELGQAIIPDRVYAAVIENLKAMNPRAIGLDVYRDQPVEPGHAALRQIFESTPNLVGIQKVIGDRDRDTIAPPPGLQWVGSNDMILDEDQVKRRGLVMVSDADQNSIPSFSLYLAGLYLEAEGIAPEPVEGNEDSWKFGNQVFHRFQPNDGGYVQADHGGYQVLLNYAGPSRHFETVSLMDIARNRVPPDWGRDRIIVIGAVGESYQDLFFTPYTKEAGNRMAGVEVHANLVSQMISAALDDRPVIKTISEPYEWLWIFLWSSLGAFLIWKWRYVGGAGWLSVQRTAAAVLSAAALGGITYGAFVMGWWIPVVPPALALLGSATAIVAYVARTAGDIRKTFGRYLTDQVVANLLENPEGLKMGGERRKLTIFTSDLRGFTALSERLPPEEVVKILNFYLGYMADVITSYQGTIDEFMGDGILVLFGAPTSRPDDATRAIACGISMQLAMRHVNAQVVKWGLPELEMGIGINTGEVVVGNIGSEKRTKYGVVGSQVNLTYRIESYTTGGQILISEQTLLDAGGEDVVQIEGKREVMPKGVKEPLMIYDVNGIKEPYHISLTREEEVFLPLSEKIPIQYTILEGKHISETRLIGHLVQLSAKGAQVRTEPGAGDIIPIGLSNLKLNLLETNSEERQEDIYAKVLEKPAAEPHCFYIKFTAKPPAVAAYLDEVYKSIPVVVSS
ncbi:CHASE2 domain-containing protein [Oscillatoria acuminata]|uniref:Putative transmembrane sensor domain protein n=1 Tax=Oscillatoria acuminata PCC 6304 TaxID=56110 RepID=K9TFJ1_9CYAN|nr:adenylate/guanylate cyclase domain-containing protein [Oscillatoria acuminata]AFY80764.1 putative transmembrane sensor domain protein [Oscillatoria acuminata PCC 6304]